MEFELTNKEREYLGLEKVEQFWDKFQLTDEIWLYFDGDIIKKAISISENSYKEEQMNEETENRKILLPKTKKGKPKKLNFSSFQARSGIHTYFSYSSKYGVRIGNYTTKKTFYETYFERISIPDFSSLKKWLNRFIKETTSDDLTQLENFGLNKITS